jgi:O-antigen ligase
MTVSSEKITSALDKTILATLFLFTFFSMFSISISQIAAGIGGIAWLAKTHITSSWQKQSWPLGISFALFSLFSLLAVIDAHNIEYSFPPLKKLFEILIFFWVVNSVKNDRLRDLLIILLICSATIASFYAIYQGWHGGFNVMNRAEGTMSVYMTFAGLLMMVGMLALGRLVFRKPHELWLWPAIGIISICLLFTFTRQAWFGFAIGLFFLTYIWKKKLTVVLTVLTIIFLISFSNQIQSRVLNSTNWVHGSTSFSEHMKYRINRMVSGNDETFLMRLSLWKGGWEVFKDNPLTGCGFRCMDLLHSQYPDPTGNIGRLRGMHNNFVQIALDTGILGLSAWISIWVCFFSSLYRSIKTARNNQSSKWIIYGSSMAVISFLTGGFFESNLYDSEVAMVLYFIMALPFSRVDISPSSLK